MASTIFADICREKIDPKNARFRPCGLAGPDGSGTSRTTRRAGSESNLCTMIPDLKSDSMKKSILQQWRIGLVVLMAAQTKPTQNKTRQTKPAFHKAASNRPAFQRSPRGRKKYTMPTASLSSPGRWRRGTQVESAPPANGVCAGR